MTAFARLRTLDSRAWSTATWLAPLTTQIILALVILTSWIFGKWFLGSRRYCSFSLVPRLSSSCVS